MKRTIMFVILLLSALTMQGAFCQAQIDADDPNIQYIGRVLKTDPKSVLMDWPGIYICASFEGTSLGIRMEDDKNTQNHYSIFIDKQPVLVIKGGSSKVLDGAKGLPDAPHTVMVVKRTEANKGLSTFKGFVLDKGKKLLPPAPRPNRRMEFIGDSYTTGYGNEGAPGKSYTGDLQNAYMAYGPMTARKFNADYHLTAYSGLGVVRNFGAKTPTSPNPFPPKFGNIMGGDKKGGDWDFNWIPDVVSVYLGINDYSTEPGPDQETFEAGYYNFIKLIRSKYKDAQIFCVFNTVTEKKGPDYVQNTVKKLNSEGDKKVYPANLQLSYGSGKKFWGCDGHPNVAGDQKMADKLFPIMEAVMTGWK